MAVMVAPPVPPPWGQCRLSFLPKPTPAPIVQLINMTISPQLSLVPVASLIIMTHEHTRALGSIPDKAKNNNNHSNNIYLA
jgi:hypothetical protein